jgi:hypothetical protein
MQATQQLERESRKQRQEWLKQNGRWPLVAATQAVVDKTVSTPAPQVAVVAQPVRPQLPGINQELLDALLALGYTKKPAKDLATRYAGIETQQAITEIFAKG